MMGALFNADAKACILLIYPGIFFLNDERDMPVITVG